METQERVRSRASRVLGRKNGSRRSAAKPEAEIDLKKLLRALQAVRDGDFSARLPSDRTGIGGKIADTLNEIIASNQRVAREIERAGQMVGKEGKTRHRITVDRRSGAWGAMESSMNMLLDDLLWPTTEVTRAISAVAKGDLSQTMPMEVEGRPLKGDELAAKCQAHLALLDIGIPVVDGYEAARRIRSATWGKAMMLVALSGWGQTSDVQRSRDSGFDTHLVMPASFDALAQLLSRVPSSLAGK